MRGDWPSYEIFEGTTEKGSKVANLCAVSEKFEILFFKKKWIRFYFYFFIWKIFWSTAQVCYFPTLFCIYILWWIWLFALMICCALLRTNAHLVTAVVVPIMLPAKFEIPFSMLQPPLVDCLLAPLCVWSHRAMLGGKWCVFDLALSGHFSS